MSSLQDRMAARSAGDVVEVPGALKGSVGGETDGTSGSQTTSPDKGADRRVSLG